MSNRFHNKFHRHNHHTRPTDRDGRYPDSAYDPIASPDSPFEGEFFVDGNITTLSSVSALGDLYASNGTFHEDVVIKGNLSVLGTTTQLDTFVYVTSAVDITNVGTGPALKVTQSGDEPIAHFIDSSGDDIIFDNNGYVGLGTMSPNEKLTIIGNVSATGNVNINGNTVTDGNSFLSGSSFIIGNLTVDTNTLFVNSTNDKVGIGTLTPNEKLTVIGNISATGSQNIDQYLTVGKLSAGLTNQVVIHNSNTLESREINSQVWDTTAEFLSGRSLNVGYIPMYRGPNTLVDSPIEYDGILTVIHSDTTVTGNLTSLGDAYFANTLFTTTSSLSIVNTGPGPALYVYQAAGASDVASFYDGDGIEVLHVGNSFNPSGNGRIGVNTSNPNVELTVVGDISATGTIYANSIILSGRSLEDVVTTTTNVTADIAAGAINAGNVVPAGTSLQKFVEQLLLKTFYPTFTNPSASMSSNLASTVESGTTGITLTVNLNRGAITGKSIGGIWQPSTFQDFRSGAATNYVINGTNNGSTNSLSFPSAIIADGSNSFSSTTTYAQGPQPVDSKGAAYLTPLASGTANANVSVAGARRGFYGVSSLANTSALIRSLGNSTNPGVSNGTSFTISIPAGATSVVFAYPSSLQNVTTVKYVEGLNAEVKANFSQTTVAVEGLNSYSAINYKVYRYVPVEPFPSSATYTVTI